MAKDMFRNKYCTYRLCSKKHSMASVPLPRKFDRILSSLRVCLRIALTYHTLASKRCYIIFSLLFNSPSDCLRQPCAVIVCSAVRRPARRSTRDVKVRTIE